MLACYPLWLLTPKVGLLLYVTHHNAIVIDLSQQYLEMCTTNGMHFSLGLVLVGVFIIHIEL